VGRQFAKVRSTRPLMSFLRNRSPLPTARSWMQIPLELPLPAMLN
jgi:hypothetical protein